MTTELPVIVVSSGEPAGIGPDISLALAKHHIGARLAVLGDHGLLADRARKLGARVHLRDCDTVAHVGPHLIGSLQVLPIALRAPAIAGRLNVANAPYVLDQLRRGAALCSAGAAQAFVTAPVQKSVITESGFRFSGHTELLAELTRAPLPVMLLAGKSLRVALATTHLPLSAVPAALDAAKLEQLLRIVAADLKSRFRIERPRLLVLGLNPHAGESGTLGDEEQRIIEPVVRKLAAEGLAVAGPVSADTAFTPESLATCDVVVAMYHDQGLPAIKALSFGEIVNVTLGLPIVRTSVDHGTALALAGTGQAREASLLAAVELAIDLSPHARVSAHVRAKKRLGQHFLHDPAVLRRLVGAIAPAPADRMVEIGPGPGALTRLLVERLDRLDAVEIDRDLAASLPASVEHPERLVVHTGDALDFDFGVLAAGPSSLRVVGNLPYNVSTPLLFHLLRFSDSIRDLHVMLQREVVERMTARPGGKEYGRLTVMLAAAARCEALFDVGPGAFSPPPKVWSTVVRITPRTPDFAIADRARFAALVAHLFSMRRKTLGRALKGRLTTDQIAAADIDPKARPETLALADFAKLAALDSQP